MEDFKMIIRYLIGCLIFASLFGCSHKTVITTVTEAQNNPILDNSISLVENKVESPVKVIGYFTNIKNDGEHQQGYSVELWKQDDNIYGLISGSSYLRLMGDPPRGILENVQFDPKSNKISFRAKVLTAILHERPGSYVPSWSIRPLAKLNFGSSAFVVVDSRKQIKS